MALAYHRFLKPTAPGSAEKQPLNPFLSLLSKLLGPLNNHKQLSLQNLANVQPFLCLGVLALQITMIMNSTFGLPIRSISSFLTALG
jgi:hypothetical protein